MKTTVMLQPIIKINYFGNSVFRKIKYDSIPCKVYGKSVYLLILSHVSLYVTYLIKE